MMRAPSPFEVIREGEAKLLKADPVATAMYREYLAMSPKDQAKFWWWTFHAYQEYTTKLYHQVTGIAMTINSIRDK